MNLLPGDAAQALLGENATPESVHALERRLHLNQPFFERYIRWLGGVLHGDLGSSLANGQSVALILRSRIPISLEIAFAAFILGLALAIPVGILAARKPGSPIDRLSMAVSMLGLSAPPFVFGILLVLVFALRLGWFPAIGYVHVSQSVGGNLKSITLPALSIALPLFGGYSRLLRADILDQLLSEDYVLTAKAKGASPWHILSHHVFRNSIFGLVTLIGLNLGTLIGATVLVEQIFAVPGIGSELLNAINNRDVPVVEGTVLVFALCVVVANIFTDLVYSIIDPRIRYGRSGT